MFFCDGPVVAPVKLHMKKTERKLQVSRETLKRLHERQLTVVVGGSHLDHKVCLGTGGSASGCNGDLCNTVATCQ
jgi:hypothetical protein